MERYPIEYTKKVNLKDLKVGDVIEPAWLWEPRMTVTEITSNLVAFDNGETRSLETWTDKVEVVKVRMSSTPEWFGK